MTPPVDLVPFKEMIRERCGLVLDGLAEETLVEAIDRRMAATGAGAPALYFATLMAREDEFQEFISLLTINETYFFREPEQLDLLVDRLLPRMLAEENARLPVRIFSAGCSTGEEPYSIAIALLERYGESVVRLVEIVAGDIDHYALARAREGRFSPFSFRALPAPLRGRYFRRMSDGGYAIDPQVASMVRFHHVNLRAGSLPPGFEDLDVVFFRNVSIYFDEPTRREILATLRDAMSHRGLLITGAAETLANDLGVLTMVEEDGAFHFARDPGRQAVVPPLRHVVARPPAMPVEAGSDTSSMPGRVLPIGGLASPLVFAPHAAVAPSSPAQMPPDLDRIRSLLREKHFEQARVLLSRGRAAAGDATPPVPDDPALLVLEGYGQLMARDFSGAALLADRALQADEWSVDAMVLLGLAAKWDGRPAEAIRWFRQAVYCRQVCWPVHFYLGDLYRGEDVPAQAQRCYRVALQQIRTNPDPDGGLLLPLNLPVPEVVFLCERHLQPRHAAKAGR